MPARAFRLLASLVLVAFALTFAGSARAWVEVHVEADDVKITLERDGKAEVEHKIRLKITGGPLRAFDLKGVDADAAPIAESCYVVPARDALKGSGAIEPAPLSSAIPAPAELLPPDLHPKTDAPNPPRVLRVKFDHERGLGRGVYLLYVRYRTDLGSRLVVDGSLTKLTWTGVAWEDGFDSARLGFSVPASPTPPRAEDASPTGSGQRADSSLAGSAAPSTPLVLAEVRRGVERDEIELIRPYAPHGEGIVWRVAFDRRAFGSTASSNETRPTRTPPTVAGGVLAPEHRPFVLAGAAGLFFLYALLVGLKAREVSTASIAAGTKARPLVPLPGWARAILAGLALVSGIALQVAQGYGTIGAAVVLVAIAFAAHLTPHWPRRSRGPGRWLPVSEREAFRDPPRPRGLFDVSSREGKALFVIVAAGVAAGVHALSLISPYHATLVAFDATALLVIFGTGRARELPPDPAIAPGPFLRAVLVRARKAMKQPRRAAVAASGDELRAVGRIRVPDKSPDPDELRLSLAPRSPLPGFGSIEVGLVHVRGAGGSIALPEVLVRVTSGSPCERALERLARRGRSTRGRKPGERVLVFTPRLPTAAMTAGIAAALARAVARVAEEAEQPPVPQTRKRAAKKAA